MVEGVPSKPYGCMSSYFNTVETNMALRRRQAQKLLSEDSNCEYLRFPTVIRPSMVVSRSLFSTLYRGSVHIDLYIEQQKMTLSTFHYRQ